MIIMLGLGVVYMDNDEKYPYSVIPNHMNPIWMCDRSMPGVLYYIVYYVLFSYDLMWVCSVHSPQ